MNGRLLLLLLLLGVVGIIAATVVFYFVGEKRDAGEIWGRNAFAISLGLVFSAFVVYFAVFSIQWLNHVQRDSVVLDAFSTPIPEVSETMNLDATAVPIQTAEPGTVVTPSPTPVRETGLNYGWELDLEATNDYVFVMSDSNLYDGPGSENSIVGAVSSGATLLRIGTIDGWSLVEYAGNRCFISNEALIVNE